MNLFFVLDASILVARLVSQDEFHVAVRTWMSERRAVGTQFVSPSLILTEVAGAVSRRTGSPSLGRKALAALRRFPGLRIVEMSNFLVLEAASLAADLGLRSADSIYVAIAKQLDLPLVTLDSEQRERGRKVISVHDSLDA